MSRYAVLTMIAACTALSALAQDTQPTTQPVANYIDLYNGFSVRLPQGLDRTNIRSATQLVTWNSRAPRSRAIAWTLAVNRVPLDKSVGIKDQLETLQTTLKDKEQFEIESAEVVKVAGADAIDIKGKATANKKKWWQRQVWVAAGDHYLTWRITGPADGGPEMDKSLTTVLDTLTLIDPKEALAQREKNLQAGAAWLKDLTKEQIEKRLKPAAQQWYQVVEGGKTVGWAVVTFEITKEGFTSNSFVQMTGPQAVAVSVGSQASFDRSTESTTARMRTANDWAIMEQDTLAGGILTCRRPNAKGVLRSVTKEVPQNTYLPLAFQQAMPLLVDQAKPATMSFAINAPNNPKLDVFTVKMEDSQEIAVGDKKVKAARVDVQRAEDQGADAYWIDSATGLVVVNQLSQGSRLVQSSKDEIDKLFPGAKPE